MFQFSSGSILGRYELLVPIAHGGMAEVWAARLHGSRGFTKLVAIKTIRAGLIDDTRLEQMLMAEAQLASRIEHPNVVSTLELGEQDETLFLVMEWADSEPLSTLIKETTGSGGIPLSVGVNVIAQACRGAHCAHELRDDNGEYLGVVHRDISPQNVLVTYTGLVKLVDFGIAKATQRASTMTEDGEVKGKLAYMSPEQVRGESVDRRTDVFALGTMLYLVTTGQHPFKGSHPGATIATLFSDDPIPSPSSVCSNYPPALEEVVLKSLRKSRDERYATAHEMLIALEAAVPEARGIEAEVAGFLTAISAGRGEQRRRHIRTAGELLDRRQDGISQLGQTATSLSAMAIGSTGTHTALPSPVSRDSQAPDFRQRYTGRWVAGAAVAVATVFGVVLYLDSRPATRGTDGVTRGPDDPTAAAQAPLAPIHPTATVDEPALDADRHPDAGASRRQSVEGRAAEPSAGATQRPLNRPLNPRRPSATRPAPSVDGPSVGADAKPRSVSSASLSQDSSSVPTNDDTSAAPRTKPSAGKQQDSWDPDTFGGRL